MFGKLFVKKLTFLKDNRGIAPLFILVVIAAAALAVPITTKVVQQSQNPSQNAQEAGSYPANYYKCKDNKIVTNVGNVVNPSLCSDSQICENKDSNIQCTPLADWCKTNLNDEKCFNLNPDAWCKNKGVRNCYLLGKDKCAVYRGYTNEDAECRQSSTLNSFCPPSNLAMLPKSGYCYDGQLCYAKNKDFDGTKYFCADPHMLGKGEVCQKNEECQGNLFCDPVQGNTCQECKEGYPCNAAPTSAPTPTPTTSAPNPLPTNTPFACSGTLGDLTYKCANNCVDPWYESEHNGRAEGTTCGSSALCCVRQSINDEGKPAEPTPTTRPGVTPGAPVAPKPTLIPGTPCTNTGEMCGKGDRSNVPNTCTYGNSATKDTWCQNTDKQSYCYSCSAGTTPVPTGGPAPVACDTSKPGDPINNCGNSSYGYLGTCSGTWSYGAGNAAKDNWCRINAGGTRAYCYTCTSNPVSTPPPVPAVGAGTPTPTPNLAFACPATNPDGSLNACRASCAAGETDQGSSAGQACKNAYGPSIGACCKAASGGALGPACSKANKQCNLSNNKNGQTDPSNFECSGCGSFCINTGVIPGSGQCVSM